MRGYFLGKNLVLIGATFFSRSTFFFAKIEKNSMYILFVYRVVVRPSVR